MRTYLFIGGPADGTRRKAFYQIMNITEVRHGAAYSETYTKRVAYINEEPKFFYAHASMSDQEAEERALKRYP